MSQESSNNLTAPEYMIPSREARQPWTVGQLARAMQAAPEVIMRKCRTKKVPGAFKFGNDWRIPAKTANAVLEGEVVL